MSKERPEVVTDEMLEYLDDLRESGEVNMFGAGQYIQRDFDLTRTQSRDVVLYWMATFQDRHSEGD